MLFADPARLSVACSTVKQEPSYINCTVLIRLAEPTYTCQSIIPFCFFVFSVERPNLAKVLSFPANSGNINIPQQIGTKFFMFGVLLLNDETGAEVSAIDTKYHGDAEQINEEILRLWIGGKGKPLSWDTLLGVLEDIGLNTLAINVKNGLHCVSY